MDRLSEFARDLSELFIEPRLRHFKTHVMISIVTLFMIGIFSLLAIVCLFMLAYNALVPSYGKEGATFLLFCFCVVMIAGAMIAHTMDRTNLGRELAKGPRRLEKAIRRSEERSAARDLDPGRLAREYFADHKLGGLGAAVLIGLMIGYQPRMAARIISRVLLGGGSRALFGSRKRYRR